MGSKWGHFGSKRGHFGLKWGHFGLKWGHFGSKWGHFGLKRGHFVAFCVSDQTLRVYSCQGSRLRALRCSRGRDVGWAILDVLFSPDASQCLYSSWSDYGGRGFRGRDFREGRGDERGGTSGRGGAKKGVGTSGRGGALRGEGLPGGGDERRGTSGRGGAMREEGLPEQEGH